MIRIIPILAGVICSYVIAAILAAAMGQVIPSADGSAEVIALLGSPSFVVFECSKLEALKSAAWIGLPIRFGDTAFSLIGKGDISMIITSIITIMPIAIATIIEHIGDISAIGSTVGKNFIEKPGLHRTLLGDGIATAIAALFGAPANTTYGENTGVLALTKVYDPRVIRIAAIFAMILSFSPKFAALVTLMPEATMGGISLILYGMISAVGVRNIVENQVDLAKSRNIIIAALILVLAIGIKFGTEAQAVSFTIGQITISLSGLAVAAVIGIFLNAVLPGNDFEFKKNRN
ncbi:MAG: uracil-xanthine permease family protein, partial [Candidatus Ornithomonoglobus sp.]